MNEVAIQLESYGCAMNQGESSMAARYLRSRGYDAVEIEHTEILDQSVSCIIFTCDVIETTQNRMWKRIDELHRSGKTIYVAGCLAAIAGDEIRERYPGTIVLDSMGVEEMIRSLSLLFPILGKELPRSDPPPSRLHHIVPLSTGCIGSCSYCLTRLARGTLKSYDPLRIVGDLKKGVLEGKREILITSQDCAAYGHDTHGRSALGDLLNEIEERVKGTFLIRVGMMNPDSILLDPDSILDAFGHPSVFKFFHIPVQSGSDPILRAMGRKNCFDDYLSLFRSVRRRYPKATISTDLIVGFPDEDGSDHEKNVGAVLDLSPDVLNVTRFSPRIGTAAHSMKGRILQRTMKARSREITSLHSGIIEEKLNKRVGEIVECMVTEKVKKGSVMARDMNYAPIVIEGDLDLGTLLTVRIRSIGRTYLKGKIITVGTQ